VARESTRAYLAEVRYRQGRWDEAIVLAELSSSLVDDTDQVWMAALPHATAARPRAARGEDGVQHVEAAAAAARAAGGGVGHGLAWVAALEVAACRRDVESGIAAVEALGSVGRPVDERIAAWRANAVEVLLAAGREADAAALADELRALASGPGSTALLRTDAARAAAALLDLDAAEAGLSEPPEDVGPYPRARLELAAGRAWRNRGERRRAAEVLRVAAQRLEPLGARPWLDRVAREVSALGLQPRRGAARRGSDLTPQEQAVAHLVARGLTNREVAAELVVSAKTVEHHLSRIYAKVGVRSRTELARALPPTP
jgi:DNA-binding CsgD family transcriptional regulator